jgi:hypothetical protein
MPPRIAMAAMVATISLSMTACSLFQEVKTEEKTNSETVSNGETAKLLPGTWKIIAVNCDPAGNNCEQYTPSRIFQFYPNGELFVNGTRRGTYSLENNTCTLDTGGKQYTVSIVQIGKSRMVTGESFRQTTEVLNRIK